MRTSPDPAKIHHFCCRDRYRRRTGGDVCRPRRGGYVAMIALVFLSLFATLAVGFYAQFTLGTQMAENDRRIALAQQAAETGMDFMRYQLARVTIPAGTPSSQVMNVLAAQLGANMNGTRNLGSDTVGLVGNVICIPQNQAHAIRLDPGGQQYFQVAITAWGSDIVLKSTGAFSSSGASFAPALSRAITMDFSAKNLPTTSFDYAVASKGQILMSKGTVGTTVGVDPSVASLMSDSTAVGAIDVTGGTVGGDLNLLAGATPLVTGGSVGGTSNIPLILADHVHTVSDANFPLVDTSVFLPYATNPYAAGAPVQQNILVPAGTNPRFNGGDTVQGIMYVKSPNTLTFRGNFNLQGFIVFENAGSISVNTLDFRGNVSQTALPPGAQFDPLRSISGVALLAPTAAVTMSGSTDSAVRGNMILGTFTLNGAANVTLDHGTLMTLSTGSSATVVDGAKSILFTATGQDNQPNTGMIYNSYFAPKPSTYQELLP